MAMMRAQTLRRSQGDRTVADHTATDHAGRCRMSLIWTIIIGFIAGLLAKFIMPGDNEPRGFIITTLLGIAGAFVATYLGQAVGFYRADEAAGFIGAVVGAIIVLAVWGAFTARRPV